MIENFIIDNNYLSVINKEKYSYSDFLTNIFIYCFMRKFILSLFVIFLGLAANAQVKGTLIDSASKKPIHCLCCRPGEMARAT